MKVTCASVENEELAWAFGTAVYFRKDSLKHSSYSHSEFVRGLAKFGEFWVSGGDDKFIRFHRVNWGSGVEVVREFQHKKKVTGVLCLGSELVFADKHGEVWKLGLEGPPEFVMGHQASITSMSLGSDCVVSVDKDYKIKVSEAECLCKLREVLLGHTSEVVSAVEYESRIYSTDSSTLVKWSGTKPLQSIATKEPLKLLSSGECLVAVSCNSVYLVESEYLQLVPLSIPLVLDSVALLVGCQLYQVSETEISINAVK